MRIDDSLYSQPLVVLTKMEGLHLVTQSRHGLLKRVVDDLLVVADSVVAVRQSLASNLA